MAPASRGPQHPVLIIRENHNIWVCFIRESEFSDALPRSGGHSIPGFPFNHVLYTVYYIPRVPRWRRGIQRAVSGQAPRECPKTADTGFPAERGTLYPVLLIQSRHYKLWSPPFPLTGTTTGSFQAFPRRTGPGLRCHPECSSGKSSSSRCTACLFPRLIPSRQAIQ